jgi:hypothetical protein
MTFECVDFQESHSLILRMKCDDRLSDVSINAADLSSNNPKMIFLIYIGNLNTANSQMWLYEYMFQMWLKVLMQRT